MWRGLLEEYGAFLPITEKTPLLSLQEGNTPLLPMKRLSAKLGVDLHVKYDGANPTGSFKDRGMVMAVAKAKEAGSKAIMCASTGNTSAAAAAYAAQAGLRCFVIIPEGKIAMGKLAQAVVYGAEIVSIEGNFDHALQMVRNLEHEAPITLVNSVNPHRIDGQKTAAFEVVDAMEKAPDVLTIPVGNAGNITAYWKGFKEYNDAKATGLPEMRGFEAQGAASIAMNQKIADPETVATAIRIGNPASWNHAVAAADESGGKIDYVSDEEIIDAYKMLAREEGVFAEPASAASIAGLIKQLNSGEINPGSRVVSVLTGNGLKDPDTAINTALVQPTALPNDEQTVFDHLLGRVGS
ncbi:threonine synthase [Salisediminibacterium halotolerans]|uniref:threonine synthase n=1 Tax=Salisediminibacterium halotolerans TaxID=517425 RepID=UPI000EB11751|nr:threonine synthase [Salisediminibacterium halotolerans]RLJ69681.1 threonine synthase [Actinophytocola xinjiangensis]RPE89739.1 threonine synthase [Salisediminibacterium halotolerans]TWG32575.1 threonine synthase [Salisediminibacterium halotolerans]GEL08074.1 threonine synthase [Salisediminibacterium halotolerans]